MDVELDQLVDKATRDRTSAFTADPRTALFGQCSVKQVQAALGHKSAKVTLDVFGHLWPGEEDRVRDAIGRLFRPDELRRTQG